MMTIKFTHQPVPLSQDEFHKIDYQVTGQAFDLHNEMGNLWNEDEYRQQLALRCAAIGLEVFEETCISVSHNGFRKNYFLDLLINGGIYELKAVSAIAKNHEAQTLNYLFIANTQHGKIINFRPDSLKWHFISTSLTLADRAMYSLKKSAWNPSTRSALDLPTLLKELLDDWGAYLSTNLYKEALCHFLGLHLENEHQRFVPLSEDTVIHFSSLSSQKNNLHNNLQKYLNRSRFDELLWINCDQAQIELSCLHHSA